ncbi:hypothetical protein [Gordonia rhizosphera]|uniref:Uncharacterized protein n=1 Tax=Gordonia rhizosphera NBRC 16068 TaxID=1108045 RepID=K6WD81_9ACTN|nr:hypothetical protein [Gordonia rhizosphera]GAB90147.1 hypothetical protein GORHZ_085_00140 [Gordonia rhizosphera NBRC 16068]
MAELIAQRWSLGVLRVTLDESPQEPIVTCEVVVNDGTEHRVSLRLDLQLTSFGFEDHVGRPRSREPQLVVPPELVAQLADWVKGGADNRAVLWIHLVKPYSVLGGVPWEEMQVDIGVPVLRLPDVLPDQRPPRGTIDIAVCAAVVEAKGDLPLLLATRQIVRAADSLGDARVHFFVDEATAAQLADDIKTWPPTSAEPIVHRWEPAADGDAVGSSRSRRRVGVPNRWLAWIQDAAGKQNFDVLHFVCHSFVTGQGDQGVLSLPRSPSEVDFITASHVTPADVLDVARTVGAFAVGFSSLPGNFSPTGMRLMADAVGANRAGPVFMYDYTQPGGDLGDTRELEYAYQLVLGRRPESSLERRLLFYLQPDLVSVDEERAEHTIDYGVALQSVAATDVESKFQSVTPEVSEAELPPWATVMARYVDEKRSDLAALMTQQRAGTLDQEGQAYMEGVEEALKHLDDVLARHTTDRS